MKQRKIVALLMAVTMVGTLIACGQQPTQDVDKDTSSTQEISSEESVETTEDKETEEKITWTNDNDAEISFLVGSDAAVDTDNLVLQEVEKQTNTKIEMIHTPFSERDAKRNALITAGDVPDIFWVGDIATAKEMKEEGLLADLTDVINAVYPEFFEEYGDEVKKVPINDDGIYMIPNFSAGYPTALTIRADWLENLGLDMPTDLESFAEVMHAFTYDDPDGNGVDDTYGLNAGLVQGYANFNTIFGAYGIAADKPLLLEDGTVTTWVKHENFLDAVKYIKGLFDDGVITPDYLTIPAMSEWEYLWTGKAGALDMLASAVTGNWVGRFTEDPKPVFDYVVLGDGGTPAVYPSYTSGTVVSADCENLEGVVRIIKYFQSLEGNHTLNLGVEGVMFQWVDKEAGTYERLGQYTDDTMHRQQGGHIMYDLLTGHEISEANVLPVKAREVHKLAVENAVDWPYILENSEVAAEYGGDMNQTVKEMWVELLQADVDDLQAIYDEYIANWEEIGGSEWEAEVTELWKTQNQ